MPQLFLGLVLGLLLGGALLYFLVLARRKSDGQIDQQMRDAFKSLAQDALNNNAEHVLRLASTSLSAQTEAARKELESDKKLIDQNLDAITRRLAELQTFVQKADRDREGSSRALTSQLQNAAQETLKLRQTAEQLASALASPQHRGQWGERMAEDVLRLAGFIENVNYFKQRQVDTSTARPDFTFPLPNGLKLNMDVKFPLANYLRYLESRSDDEKLRFGRAFLGDVRSRIKEAATRNYINPAENTVDYALVFIANEQVYAAIYELDPAVIDEALGQKIVLCSPLTLYAVLAVIRQAAENITMQRQSQEIASLVNTFAKQWLLFKDELKKLGDQIDTAQKTYSRLATTRINQLEKPLEKIDELRSAHGSEMIPPPEPEK